MKPGTLRNALLVLMIGLVVGLQSYRGVTFAYPELGPTREQQLQAHDFRWLYVAGRAWLEGTSPHVPANFFKVWNALLGNAEAPLASPPTLAVVSVPVALLPWDRAYILYDAINIAAYALILLFLLGTVRHRGPPPPRWRIALALGVVALSSAVPGVIYAGQTSLVATAGIAGALYCTLKGRLWLAACWMVLASIKPQLSLLPLVWLCVWRPMLLPRTALTVGMVVAASLALAWDPQFLSGMIEGLRMYRNFPFNRLENSSVGLYRWFGPGMVASAAPWVAVAATLVLAYWQRRSANVAVLGIPMLLTALLMPIHPYDLTLLMIPVGLWVACRWSWWYLPAVLLVLRPNVVGKLIELAGSASPDSAVFYARWLALAFCLVLVIRGARRVGEAS
jgi:Glycosyltransferase family 87